MRKCSLDMVHALARRDGRVVFIGSNLSPNLLGDMKKEFPQRYYMEGISEANVVGMAAGMALEGYISYVNIIATFLTRRCYAQVAVDLCVHVLPVRLIGNGGGYVYAPFGPTHRAIEDIAIMRALPDMTVTAACDAEEMTRLMEASLDQAFLEVGKDEGLLPASFQGNKIAVKRALLAERRDGLLWQTLQGLVYGRRIDAASLFDGAADFLALCQQRGTEVLVVSHKTELAHHDPLSTNLRHAALRWMEARGLFDSMGLERIDWALLTAPLTEGKGPCEGSRRGPSDSDAGI
ncbi:MAG: hypothetical protein AB7F22_23365 [Reyranella sp.]|uniref:hypothetical protein n=1 Tax=Reyranella sp. TaxID=1929291 RepID=UPI003D0D0882